jgi:hypothetical protein
MTELGKRIAQFVRWPSFYEEQPPVILPITVNVPSQFVMAANQSAGRRIPQFVRASALLYTDDQVFGFSTTPPTVTLGIALFENYFTDLGPTIVVQSDPLSIISVPIVPNSFAGNFQPISIGQVKANFGINDYGPTQISGLFSGTQLFNRPFIAPVSVFGTADSWGSLGQQALGGQLLVAPGNGGLSGKQYFVVAGGTVSVPELNSTALWSVVCKLTGNGRNNGILRADTLVNGSSVQVLYSNQNYYKEPQLQLSLGINYTFSGTTSPLVTLMQFELQEII